MRKKIGIILLIIILMFLYVPINRNISGGVALETGLDKIIFALPIFVVPYLSADVFWIVTIIFINYKNDFSYAKYFDLQMIIATLFSLLIYIVLPTFVVRAPVIGGDVFSNILNWVYQNDMAYNAAPSGHTFYTIICVVALFKALPKYKFILLIYGAIVILSTLFTKQHYVLDVLIGGVFAGVVILFVDRIYKKSI